MTGQINGRGKQKAGGQDSKEDRLYSGDMARREIELHRDERVSDGQRQATSMHLPVAVHYRLDKLVNLAHGVNSSRAEIVAMLIASAPLDEDELERQIIAYRKLRVGDAIPSAFPPTVDGEDSVVVPLHGPGRRKQQSAGG
jgi:hypothetical protein